MIAAPEFERVNPRTLTVHPENESVFGSITEDLERDPEFLESVSRSGVQTPILITPDGRVLSGHRRLAAALRFEKDSVPVLRVPDASEDAEERLWLESNLQRQMTNEQRARWFKRLQSLETVKAANRQHSGVRVISSQGRAADLAAEKTGWARQTATRAAAVVDEIDRAADAGNDARAAELREKLNQQSVNAAYQAVRAPEPDTAGEDFGDDDSDAVRTFSKHDATKFRAAFQLMIRTIDRAYFELEQIDSGSHRVFVERFKSLGNDWQKEFPNQEWL